MISHQHKCVFVHIPKNAGQSIEHIFLKWNKLRWETRASLLLRPNGDPTKGPPRLAHLRADQYVTCGHLSRDLFESYFKFSLVRNPWDRALSIYKYMAEPRDQSFRDFLPGQFRNDLWKTKYWFVGPQHEFIYDDRGTLLVDFVGRFETLQADFDRVCERLSMPRTPVPHVNRSGEHGGLLGALLRFLGSQLPARARDPLAYVKHYDEASRELVGRLYARDIELFGYAFGEPVSSLRPLEASVG